MDRELRDLERRASQGDKGAEFRLLIRKLTLNDFNLSDLNANVREKIAMELMKSLSAHQRTQLFMRSEPGFVEGPTSISTCPTLDCDGGADDFDIYELAWQSYPCDVDYDEDVIGVFYSDGEVTVLGHQLHCQRCDATWRPKADIEGV